MADANTRTKEISAMIENVGSNNGKIEDMRDGYTELGELYKRAWLRDNRPYWLDNNLRRYDRAAELWIGRADRWQSQVVQQWWDTKTLPLPEQVGLVPLVSAILTEATAAVTVVSVMVTAVAT